MPRIRKSGDGGLYFDAKRKLWIGVIDNGLTPDGKRKQIRVSSRLQSKAREKLESKRAEMKQNNGSPFGNQTVGDWGAYWLEHIQKPKMKPQPFRSYQSVLKTWIYPVIEKRKVKDVRPSDLRRIYDNIKRKRSSATALKAHVVISSMFEAARLEGIVSSNVANDITPPRVAKSEKALRGTFEPDVTRRILDASLSVRHGTKWVVSLYAGIRQGERLGATIDSVDLARGLFTVRWNLVEANYEHGCDPQCDRKAGWCLSKRLVIPDGMKHRVLEGRLVLLPPKSNEDRTFAIPPGLIDKLDQHIAELSLRPNPHGLLWPAADGSPMTGREDQAEWRALIALAGVEDSKITSYWARHTAISDLAAVGVSDRIIGDTVGHRSPGVTGNYTHLSIADSTTAMDKLETRRQPSE